MSEGNSISLFLGGERVNTPTHKKILGMINQSAQIYGVKFSNEFVLAPKDRDQVDQSLATLDQSDGLVGYLSTLAGIDRGLLYTEITEILHANKVALLFHEDEDYPLFESLMRSNTRLLGVEIAHNREKIIQENIASLVRRVQSRRLFNKPKFELKRSSTLLQCNGLTINLLDKSYRFEKRKINLSPTDFNILLTLAEEPDVFMPAGVLWTKLRTQKRRRTFDRHDLAGAVRNLNEKIADGRYEVETRADGYALPVNKHPLPRIIQNGEFTLDLVKRVITKGDISTPRLGSIQFATVLSFFQNIGVYFTNSEIAQKIWGADDLRYYRNLETVTSDLRIKLQTQRFINRERGKGWIMPDLN